MGGGLVEVVEGIVALPDDILELLGLRPGDAVELIVDGDRIVLRKRAATAVH